MSPAIEALNAGSIDITIGSITATISALVGGSSEFTILRNSKAIFIIKGLWLPEAGIKGPSDLRGKRIAVNRGGTGEYLLYKALEKGGLDASEVEIVYLPPTEADLPLKAGKSTLGRHGVRLRPWRSSTSGQSWSFPQATSNPRTIRCILCETAS